MRTLCTLVLVLLALPCAALAAPRTVHVVVALCDNQYQGIVPVPAGIGNGQQPRTNLYWGASYGVKTFFSRKSEWKLAAKQEHPAPGVLERVVFRNAALDLYLVADAYDGKLIKDSIQTLLNYAAGARSERVDLNGLQIKAGSDADLIVYVGHNGLMDFTLDETPASRDAKKRPVAVFACMSRQYFTEPLATAGAEPLILTTNLMCPEAYTTHALINAWARGADRQTMRRDVARAYSTYQKCSEKAAMGLFVNGTR